MVSLFQSLNLISNLEVQILKPFENWKAQNEIPDVFPNVQPSVSGTIHLSQPNLKYSILSVFFCFVFFLVFLSDYTPALKVGSLNDIQTIVIVSKRSQMGSGILHFSLNNEI